MENPQSESKVKIPEIDNLAWTGPHEIQTKKYGVMLVKKAPPNDQFWNLWRDHKETLRAAGFSVNNFGGVWSVNWWQHGDVWEYPVLPSLDDDVPDEIILRPLVNENKLLDYQPLGVQYICAAMEKYGSSLNGCGTGVGKTYITLGAVRETGRRLLVICPKTITNDWVRAAFYMGVELAGCYGWEWIKTGKTPFGGFEKHEKTGKKLKGTFQWNLPDDVDIVFDEVHRAAAISTQNAEMVIAAKNQGARIYMLSATIANDPTKMRATGYVLGLHNDGKSFYAWMEKHGVREDLIPIGGGRKIKVWKFYGSARHLQAIHKHIFPVRGYRITAEELGDKFPETQILAKAYEMDEEKEIRFEYARMQQEVERIMAEKKGSEAQACILVEILRARQRVELLKVPLFVSLTRDYEAEGHSVIIAVNFVETLEQICKELKITAVIAGVSSGKKIVPGYSENDRILAVDDFQANKVNKIAGIIAAMREGLNLHDIHGGHPRVSLISPGPSAFYLKQVLGRPWRAGGKTKSIQRILFAANTIEEQVCEGLATKLDQLDILMDGDLQKGIFPNCYSSMRPEDPEE